MPSASLIPHDPTVLFTVAGMVPFKPYFVGDEAPPYRRAVSSQKCARAGGKHNDLDDVGRTKRHLVFFEMMGNFSFGDYFKSATIPWSWELVDRGRGASTATACGSRSTRATTRPRRSGTSRSACRSNASSDSATRTTSGRWATPVRAGRAARSTSTAARRSVPTAARSVIPRATGSWSSGTSCSCSTTRRPTARRTPLPKPSIDTGAGLERILALLQGVDSVWETDLMLPLIDTACSLTGKSYRVGDYDDRDSFAMRVLAEHARSSTMLVSDGVFPSNEGRGYVLRRILRRAVRYAYLLGTEQLVMPRLVETAIDVMGNAYPDVVKNRDFIVSVLTQEEERFRHTLQDRVGDPRRRARRRHADAVGPDRVPAARHVRVPARADPGDRRRARHRASTWPGSRSEMAAQRERAKAARKGVVDDVLIDGYREVVEQFGVTEFLGYSDDTTESRVLAVDRRARRQRPSQAQNQARSDTVEIFLDRTPFYAESGGQVGDTGTITTETGTAEVLDTTFALPGLRRHTARVTSGTVAAGQTATASDRRRSAQRDPPEPHRHARAALGAAQGARRARQAGRLVGRPRPAAVRLLALRGGHRRADRGDRTAGQRRDARQRTGAGVRDHQGRGRGARRDRLLRRQVRRHRPGARGGQLDRAVRRHARPRHRRHRHDQGRQRGVDRFEPAPHRSDHRRQQRRPVAGATSARSSTSPSCSARRLPPSRRVRRRGSTRSRRCRTRTGRCAPSWPSAAPASSRPRRRTVSSWPASTASRRPTSAIWRSRFANSRASDASCWRAPRRPAGSALVAAVQPSEGIAAADLIRDAAKAVGGGGGGKGDIATAGRQGPGRASTTRCGSRTEAANA